MFILAVWSKNLYHSDAMLTLIKLYHCFSKSADSSHRVLIIHSPEGTLCVFKPVLAIRIYKQEQTNNTIWKNKQTNKQHASQTTPVSPSGCKCIQWDKCIYHEKSKILKFFWWILCHLHTFERFLAEICSFATFCNFLANFVTLFNSIQQTLWKLP